MKGYLSSSTIVLPMLWPGMVSLAKLLEELKIFNGSKKFPNNL